jgi:hypothetical protein
MRLIIEKLEGTVYVYLEDEAKHRANEASRLDNGSRRLTCRIFDEECDTSVYADSVHWVFDVALGLDDCDD